MRISFSVCRAASACGQRWRKSRMVIVFTMTCWTCFTIKSIYFAVKQFPIETAKYAKYTKEISLLRVLGRGKLPLMKTLTVDAHKRIRIPDATPKQVFAYTRNENGTLTL